MRKEGDQLSMVVTVVTVVIVVKVVVTVTTVALRLAERIFLVRVTLIW